MSLNKLLIWMTPQITCLGKNYKSCTVYSMSRQGIYFAPDPPRQVLRDILNISQKIIREKVDDGELIEMGDKWFGMGQTLHNESLILRAEQYYSRAIAMADGDYEEYYARRSAARATLGDLGRALKDAEKAISLNPNWSGGYAQKGSALEALSHYQDAIEAYKKALELDSGNVMLSKELTQVESAYDAKKKHLIEKLKAQPHSRDWLNDPEYLENVKKIAQGSWYLRERVNECGDVPDLRLFHADSIVSGFDKYITISGKSEVVENPQQNPQDISTPPSKVIKSEKPNNGGTQPCKSALKENDLGNDAFKKNDFGNASKYYQNIDFDPKNMISYTNIAEMYFEKKEYEKCIKECEKAVKIGRENNADCKLIAEAFTKIGAAYEMMSQWQLAKNFYEKSISEYDSPETKALLKMVESRIST